MYQTVGHMQKQIMNAVLCIRQPFSCHDVPLSYAGFIEDKMTDNGLSTSINLFHIRKRCIRADIF